MEDDDLVREYLCLALREAGHDVEGVRTKAEADAALARRSHELLVADVRLPDGNGRELMATANGLGLRTVLITGHPDEIRALAIAGQVHLRKPFPMSELIELIETLLGP